MVIGPSYKDNTVEIDKEGNFRYKHIEGSLHASIGCMRTYGRMGNVLTDAQYSAFCQWLEYQLFLDRWCRRRDRALGGKKLKVLL